MKTVLILFIMSYITFLVLIYVITGNLCLLIAFIHFSTPHFLVTTNPISISIVFFFFNNCIIYLDCAGFSLLHRLFSPCGVRASHLMASLVAEHGL